MSLELERVLATPDHHFLTFDGGSALFLPMDRISYHRSAFLDGRAEAKPATPIRVEADPLIKAAMTSQPPQTGWIFHVARCGSTLLSRLIDSVDSSLVLREPPPLRQMGLAAAAGDRSETWKDRLKLAHLMAARRFDPARPTIVKANVPVNFMLPDLRKLDLDAPAIFLYQPFEPYLVSILRAPQHRIWVERISDQVAPTLSAAVGITPGSTLPERAAALWTFQMLVFEEALQASTAARSLDAGSLFEMPVDAARETARHLGAIDADVEGNAASLLGRYAKDTSRHFSDEDRHKRDAEDRLRLDDEVSQAKKWLDRCAVASRLPGSLGRPLVGEAPNLLD